VTRHFARRNESNCARRHRFAGSIGSPAAAAHVENVGLFGRLQAAWISWLIANWFFAMRCGWTQAMALLMIRIEWVSVIASRQLCLWVLDL